MASALGLVFGIEAEMNQRVVPLAGFHDHISALAAVAAGRAAARNIFFAAEGHAAVAAVPRLHSNFRLIDKHDAELALPRLSIQGSGERACVTE